MRKALLRYDFWIAFLLFVLAVPAEYYEIFPTMENEMVSFRQILRNSYGDPKKRTFPENKIFIVTTDEAFFKEYKSWPLRRADIGKIANNLKKLGAKVVGLDILMDFPSSYKEDPTIAKHLTEAKNILVVAQAKIQNNTVVGINYPTKVIRDASKNAYSNHPPIGKMLSRVRVYPDAAKNYRIWPFAVKLAAMSLGVEPKLEKGKLILGKNIIPLDHFNDIRIDFAKIPQNSRFLVESSAGSTALEFLDLSDLDEDDLEELKFLVKGKIVLLGDTSKVSHDIFDTPIGEVYGVEVLANTISTILSGGKLKSAYFSSEILVVAIIFILVFLSAHLSRPIPRNIASFAITAGYVGFTSWIYIHYGIAFSMSYILIAIFLSYTVVNLNLYIQERKQKTFIKGAFEQYLSPDVIDIIVKDPSKLSLGGVRKEMTAFFSDVQGFSTISESLTPDELVQLLNEYLTEMCDIMAKFNGTVDKFEGDAIIGFWGAPLPQLDHAKLACFTTIEMQHRLVELRKKWRLEGKHE
ncbi:MAG: adenylate cyclase, partial [bacterium]